MAGPAAATVGTLNVEPAAFAVGFATALRRAGLIVSPERTGWLTEALRIVPPRSRSAFYRTSRTVFLSSHAQLPVFDAVFSAVFDGRLDPSDTRGDQNAPPAIGSEARSRPTAADSRPASPGEQDSARQPPAPSGAGDRANHEDEDSEPKREALLAVASAEERLHTTSFAELSERDIADIRRLVRRIVLSTPQVRGRRSYPTARTSARLDLRRTIGFAQRAGTDPTRLFYSHRRPKPRGLVFLCDVSASMEPYTRVFLSLLQGAVIGAQAEAFVFSTRLTRLTRPLMLRNADDALARAASSAVDWAGGTRLAGSIRQFIDLHGRRGMARGAVIVILSDGWAQDAPEDVGAQMARLRRLAHTIVWVNPRTAAPGYRPLVGGMAAAIPYCDSFISGHSYAALAEVAAAIRADRSTNVSPPSSQNPTEPEKTPRN